MAAILSPPATLRSPRGPHSSAHTDMVTRTCEFGMCGGKPWPAGHPWLTRVPHSNANKDMWART